MLPVRCLTCGKVISALLGRFERGVETAPVRQVLDDLGVRRFCCRKHFITYRRPAVDAPRLEGELVPGIATIERHCTSKRAVLAR